MNLKRAIIAGVIVWILLIIFYVASYSFHIIKNAELQANMILCLALIPCARAGAQYYYKKGNQTNGFLLGVVMVFIAIVLDSLITVPVFIIPAGGSHISFFSDPAFWIIAIEYLVVVTVFSFVRKTPNTVAVNSGSLKKY